MWLPPLSASPGRCEIPELGKNRMAKSALAVLAVLLAMGMNAPQEAQHHHPPLPSDLPLSPEGVPTRALTDEELFRLLAAMSGRNDVAAALLARCHASGTPFGSEGWRTCIERSRP